LKNSLPLLLLLLAWPFGCIFGQNEDDPVATGELLENFFRANESAGESDAQLFLENLALLRQQPLDLNRADRSELQSIGLLSELQIENLLKYRQELGSLLNVFELQAVQGWEVNDIQLVMPFVKVSGGLDQRAAPLRTGLRKGQDEILVRVGRFWPDNPLADRFEGSPWAIATRYRHQFDNRLRYGFTAEKDPGEALFQQSNRRGFDFYSAHFFLQNTGSNTLRTLAIGDYRLRLGQGLLVQSGFSPGKSAESVALLRGGRKLNPYSGFGENFFLRGGAVTVRLRNAWEFTAFGSYRNRDANLDVPTDSTDIDPEEVVFTSLQNSGLHRTESEIADERSLAETVGGANLEYQHRNGHIGVNAVGIRYNREWLPTESPYRRFALRGRQLTAVSVDYLWRRNNVLWFGENARSDNGGLALLNGLLLGADRRATVAVLHRYFTPDYQAVYAAPFAEATGANNEHGVYFGLEVRPSKPWKVNAYADLWRHPWLRFNIDAPSVGQEYLLRVLWQPNKVFQSYVLAQTETKERTFEGQLLPHERRRLRLHAAYKLSATLELRSRVEWMRFRIGQRAAQKGFLMYQELVCKPRNFPVSGSMRYAMFDTDDFNSRVFAFENDIFSAVSIPALAGQGNRFYINLRYRITDVWRVESRFETTLLRKAVTSGSVVGRETAMKLVVIARFD
jgi:hypothetical protein